MRTKKIFLCFIMCLITLSGQVPDTLWTRTFGAGGSDVGYSVDQTNDGGYIIAGFTESFGFGNYDVWLIKTNEFGDTNWTKVYGGELNDVAFTVHQTFEGGYVLSGLTDSFGKGNGDFWLIKTDANGDTIWTRTYGDTLMQWCRYSEQTNDSGFILIGITDIGSPYIESWLIKTDKNGAITWTKYFSGSGNGIQETFDGGYIFIGGITTGSNGGSDIQLIKTDDNGDSIWVKTFGGIYSEGGYSVKQTSDGGFIVAGSTESMGSGKSDIWLLKTNENGDTAWTKVYGGIENEWPTLIQQTFDGGYIISGYTYSFGEGNSDAWLIKTDANGNVMWDKTFGGENSDEAFSVQQTKDSCYIMVGATKSFAPDDLWLIKIEMDSFVNVEENIIIPTEYVLRQNYPNPFNPVAKIKYELPENIRIQIKVYDVLGNEVATLIDEYRNAGFYEIEFNGSDLSSGVYFYRIQAGDFVETKKMILMK